MSRNPISKTGLIASPRKQILRIKSQQSRNEIILSKCAIAKPVQFSLRPFGGLFNPYAKGCSILCNHPGPNEVKNVVKQAKENWLHEGKSYFLRDDKKELINASNENDDNDIPENIPEEFFRRYTGSDSRPLTPTPTVISGRTRTSTGSHYNARRCFTPEPINSTSRERKQLILDLRRSHSQETLFWNASSELSVSIQVQDTQNDKPEDSSRQKNIRLCEQEAARKKSAEKKQKLQEQENKPIIPTTICVNERDIDEEEDDIPRRRGKKKRKSKQLMTTTFHISQEPETHITTLGPDSPNPSTRPSLIPNGINMPRLSVLDVPNKLIDASENYIHSSFISEDSLKILRRGLNIDIIEGTFDRYRKRALQEALRTATIDKVNFESDALKQFKETLDVKDVDNEKWLSMPRKYTRNSARFGLPVNMYNLTKMKPIEYLRKYIWISDYRKQLYNFVFTKFYADSMQGTNSPNRAGDETYQNENQMKINLNGTERTISFTYIDAALKDVLGFHATVDKIDDIKKLLLLNVEDHPEFDFRTWCGIVAFSERYLNELSKEEDPCDEVEVADFESLERKFSIVNVQENLKVILTLLKNTSDN